MAALGPAVADVLADSAATRASGVAGEVVDSGECVYVRASDGKIMLSQSDGTQAEAECVGVAINSAPRVDAPVTYVTEGDVALGTGTLCEIYLVSATPGKMAQEADIAAGYVSVIGIGYTGSIRVQLGASGLTF